MASNTEIKAYHDGVVEKYGLREKMRFHAEVDRCVWNEESSTWTLYLTDLKTGKQLIHVSNILFAATGQLVQPNPCEIPGKETFKGEMFHSARWRQDVDLTDKRVVVIGNGCKHVTVLLLDVKD